MLLAPAGSAGTMSPRSAAAKSTLWTPWALTSGNEGSLAGPAKSKDEWWEWLGSVVNRPPLTQLLVAFVPAERASGWPH